ADHDGHVAVSRESGVVGREEQFTLLDVELARLTPGAVLIDGEPGIGKTTFWEAALERARRVNRTVLACRGAAAETRLSFAALGDLLEPLGQEALTGLPSPQRRALAAALLLEDAE